MEVSNINYYVHILPQEIHVHFSGFNHTKGSDLVLAFLTTVKETSLLSLPCCNPHTQ